MTSVRFSEIILSYFAQKSSKTFPLVIKCKNPEKIRSDSLRIRRQLLPQERSNSFRNCVVGHLEKLLNRVRNLFHGRFKTYPPSVRNSSKVFHIFRWNSRFSVSIRHPPLKSLSSSRSLNAGMGKPELCRISRHSFLPSSSLSLNTWRNCPGYEPVFRILPRSAKVC